MLRLFRQASMFWALVLTAAAFGQDQGHEKVHRDVVARIRDEGFQRSQVMDYAWYLSDVIGPRLASSPNMIEAEKWAKSQMDVMGLENTARETYGRQSVSWEVQYVSIHMIEPDYQPIIAFPPAFSSGTNGVLRTKAMRVDIQDEGDFDKYRGRLKGAIVLTTPPRALGPRTTPEAQRHGEESLSNFLQKGTDLNMSRRREAAWMKKPPRTSKVRAADIKSFLKEEGVALVLTAAKGGDGTIFVTGRGERTRKGVEDSLPTLAVAAEHYNRLHRLIEHGIDVQIEAEVRVSMIDNVEGSNVVGEITGGDLAEEVVLIGGHLDSWHSATGATDNASGSAVVLEAMRILKAIGVKPRRTIRAALWDHEEGGRKGSKGYVKNHLGNPRDGKKGDYEKFSVYFNMDNGAGQFRGVHQQGNPYVGGIFKAWMQPFNDLRVESLSNFSNRSTDHMAFDDAGLPGFQFIQDRIDYRTRTHHSNMDVFDKLLPEDLKINAVVMASFAYHAAMRDERIPRKSFTAYNPKFRSSQGELFASGGAVTNALADYDNDGDLDLFVGFTGTGNRLYKNDNGTFVDVAGQVGLADKGPTRASAWGDYDNDGHLDLFVGIAARRQGQVEAKLYRNQGNGKGFVDVSEATGVRVIKGRFRQPVWVDYDNDGDVDLFLAIRYKPNVLLRNDGGKFIDVAQRLGLADTRKTVGAVWFDYDKDGDLDLFIANMDGDTNGMFRNDGERFVDVAVELGLASGGRPLGLKSYGSVRPSLGDYDNDGDFDIFMSNYGANALLRNDGGKSFSNVGPSLGLTIDGRYDAGVWGDYNNDGLLDLYVNGTVTGGVQYPDFLFHNDGDRFIDVTPGVIKSQNADHGVQWADIDSDGDLDLALTGNTSEGMHFLFLNQQSPDRAARSMRVLVLDENGRYTRAGSEVRLYRSRSGELLGTRILDTGSGYNSQNAMPVHFGLTDGDPVDVEVTVMSRGGRKVHRTRRVDPKEYRGRVLIVKTGS